MNIIKKLKAAFRSKQDPVANTWTEQEFNLFKNNLQQVISWSQELTVGFDYENGKYGRVFRQTNPVENDLPLYRFDGKSRYHRLSANDKDRFPSWNNDEYTMERYDFLLQEAIKQRTTGRQFDWLHLRDRGRILSFQTCVTTHDGATVVESNNFVDEADVPPIDTWFYLKRNYLHGMYPCGQALFCWIPREFEQVMQHTIGVEILGSYQWLDINDPIIWQQLKNSPSPTLPL